MNFSFQIKVASLPLLGNYKVITYGVPNSIQSCSVNEKKNQLQ